MKLPQGFTHVFAVPGERNIVDIVNPETGRSWVYGDTLEELRKRHPRAEIVSWDAWVKERAAEQDVPVTWAETTQERYDEMLNVLPPFNLTSNLTSGGFQVGEPTDHHVLTNKSRYASFLREDGKYLVSSRPMTSEEFRNELVRRHRGR